MPAEWSTYSSSVTIAPATPFMLPPLSNVPRTQSAPSTPSFVFQPRLPPVNIAPRPDPSVATASTPVTNGPSVQRIHIGGDACLDRTNRYFQQAPSRPVNNVEAAITLTNPYLQHLKQLTGISPGHYFASAEGVCVLQQGLAIDAALRSLNRPPPSSPEQLASRPASRHSDATAPTHERRMVDIDTVNNNTVVVTLENNNRIRITYLDDDKPADPSMPYEAKWQDNSGPSPTFHSPFTSYIFRGSYRSEEQKMLTGEPFDPDSLVLAHHRRRVMEVLKRLERSSNLTEMLRLFRDIVLPKDDPSFCFGTRIARGFRCLYGRINLGCNVVIGPECRFNDSAEIKIGNDCWIGRNTSILTSAIVPILMTSGRHEVASKVTVEDGCTIGEGVHILGGVTIGRGSVIRRCSVVNVNVPPGSTWPANPGRQDLRSAGVSHVNSRLRDHIRELAEGAMSTPSHGSPQALPQSVPMQRSSDESLERPATRRRRS